MKLTSITFEEWEKKQMRDPEFRKAIEKSKPHYDLIRQSIRARLAKKIHSHAPPR